MDDYRLHVVVRGKVQGVGFRAYTQRLARSTNLRGWARNREDGSVEMLLCGPRRQVLAIVERLRQGPPLAQVTQLHSEETTAEPPQGFETR